jgi:hypothetical protein
MASRPVPAPKKIYSTTAEAVEFLGIDEKMLRRLADATDWLRPTKLGAATRWHWMDLVCLAHVIEARKKNVLPPAAPGGPQEAPEGTDDD